MPAGMSKLRDLTGRKFGRLTVIGRDTTRPKGKTWWRCRCDCGNESIVWAANLLNGHTASCGCLADEARRHPRARRKHSPSIMTEDIIGRRYGRLVVTGYAGRDEHHRRTFYCRCDCGNDVIAIYSNLQCGDKKSCGCIRRGHPPTYIKHGDSRSGPYRRIHSIWKGMVERCEFPQRCSQRDWRLYGARGIRVCAEWHDYGTFKDWALAHGYNDSLTIDRIDPDGDYEPSNCRWADFETQANNRRGNVFIEYQGERLTVAQWSRRIGVSQPVIHKRLKAGWSPERILTTPADRRSSVRYRLEYDGKSLTTREWSAITGLSVGLIRRRMHAGWDTERILTEPLHKEYVHGGKRRYEHDGRNLTLEEWESETGIPCNVIRRRLHDGWSVERALTERYPATRRRCGKPTSRTHTPTHDEQSCRRPPQASPTVPVQRIWGTGYGRTAGVG